MPRVSASRVTMRVRLPHERRDDDHVGCGVDRSSSAGSKGGRTSTGRPVPRAAPYLVVAGRARPSRRRPAASRGATPSDRSRLEQHLAALQRVVAADEQEPHRAPAAPAAAAPSTSRRPGATSARRAGRSRRPPGGSGRRRWPPAPGPRWPRGPGSGRPRPASPSAAGCGPPATPGRPGTGSCPAATTSEHGRMARSTRNWRGQHHQKSCMVTTTLAPDAAAMGTRVPPSDCRAWRWTTSGRTSARWAAKWAPTSGLSKLRSSPQPIHRPLATHRTARPVSSTSSQLSIGGRSPSHPA